MAILRTLASRLSLIHILLAGKEVVIPRFNFVTGHKEYGSGVKKLGENDVLVIEGIHCLNPKLTESLPDENKFKIYISALTPVSYTHLAYPEEPKRGASIRASE